MTEGDRMIWHLLKTEALIDDSSNLTFFVVACYVEIVSVMLSCVEIYLPLEYKSHRHVLCPSYVSIWLHHMVALPRMPIYGIYYHGGEHG